MAGGNLSPRQKMIGMMYLVLTALLAMNISKDILNAFVIINDGLEVTNKNFYTKNALAYDQFTKAKNENPVKVTPFFNKAMQARTYADDLVKHIESLKRHLIQETEKIAKAQADTTSLSRVDSKDNFDIPTHILIGEPSSPNKGQWSAYELKGKINKTRSLLLGLVDKKSRAQMKVGMNTPDFGMMNGVNETWETGNFYHTPLAASITILSKLQSDVRNAEFDVVKELYSAVDASDFKFDTLAAKIIPNSNYVLIGDEYKADVFVAAFSTTQNPEVLVGTVDTSNFTFKGKVDSVFVEKGVGRYIKKPTTEGLVKWGGLINVKAPDGSIKSYPFNAEYMVARPALVVSADKMNVMYIGVDNPISISVPGIAAENIKPSMSSGSLSGSRGKYIGRVTQQGVTKINVSANFAGEVRSMGSVEFRVKRLPDPFAYIAGKKGDTPIKKSELMAAGGIIPKMDNFDFDLRIDIVSFDVTLNVNGDLKTIPTKGNKLSPDQLNLLKTTKSGSKVYIENIKAKMPDGTTRSLSSINLKITL